MRRQPLALLLTLLLVGPAAAEVTRVDVTLREDVLPGRAFGLAGGYEKLAGTVHYAVDPALDENLIVTDIDKAPVDDRGRVVFSADFYLLKPKEIKRGNGALLLEVGNRGRKGLLGFFDRAESSLDPETEAHFGDGFLLDRGFTLLWVGWQWDTPREPGIMRMSPPVATDDGAPILGLVRSDFVPTELETHHSLADRGHIAYPVADPDARENRLTVRDAVEGPRELVPRNRWGFGRVANGAVVPDPRSVYVKGGFQKNRIYEVVYVSENPPLVGLGPVAIRDFASHLKYDGEVAVGAPRGSFDRALAFGISQSGRFLRTFLYHGFNADESSRKVFDGVIAHVAGGGRGSFNHRFAQASRDAHPFLNFFYPTDIFPFTDVEQIDFRTGTSDGLLVYQKPEHQPKIFYTNSSYEYWGRAASLTHTTVDGREDARLPGNVRIYQFAGSQHVPASFPPRRTIGQQPSNPMDFRWGMRALLVAMDRWTREGAAPPESRYPKLENGTLVRPADLGFPKIAGVAPPGAPHRAYRADYGDRFRTEGIVTKQPPAIGDPYPIFVPAVDADGNEIAGVRLPEQAVPLATYTGWNLFDEASGPPDVLSSMQGSFLAFPRTDEERRERKDPRASIEERYRGREEYLGRVAEASLDAVASGYLLAEDVAPILEEAGRHWDAIAKR